MLRSVVAVLATAAFAVAAAPASAALPSAVDGLSCAPGSDAAQAFGPIAQTARGEREHGRGGDGAEREARAAMARDGGLHRQSASSCPAITSFWISEVPS